MRKIVYVKGNLKQHQFEYTGIEFYEFYIAVNEYIKNILLLKGNFLSDKCCYNFELIEGKQQIELLIKDKPHDYGDFCFVDYQLENQVKELTPEEIARLLYLAHMFQPINSPFMNKLTNNFVYLAHDDGFFCKLFCKELIYFQAVLSSKIINMLKQLDCETEIQIIPETIMQKLLLLTEHGLYLDLEDFAIKNDQIVINVYAIGLYKNFDQVYNEKNKILENVLTKKSLIYRDNFWEFQ